MAYVVAANGTFFEKLDLLLIAAKSYQIAAEDAAKPGGGIKTDWSGRLTTAKTALDAAHTAALTAIGNEVVVNTPASINPAIGYGSMTGAAGVAVAPNP
jgi:hypothetical protein